MRRQFLLLSFVLVACSGEDAPFFSLDALPLDTATMADGSDVEAPDDAGDADAVPEDAAPGDTEDTSEDVVPDTPCMPNCDGRECGPDPVCGETCGACAEGLCSAQGACVLAPAGAPEIVSLIASRETLTEGESITLTAVVTDPNGPEDVIAGTVTDPDGELSYGAFSRVSDAGWEIDLDWETLHEVADVTFVGGEARVVQARFFDGTGAVAARTLTIALSCPVAACAGACVTLETTNACGACGVACAAGQVCDAGVCECPPGQALCGGSCVPLGTRDRCTSCDDSCRGDQLCGSLGCDCPIGQAECDGLCVSLRSRENCTACGDECVGTQTCGNGGCTCREGETLCGERCTELGTLTDCLSCGDACGAGQSCTDEGCECPGGQTLCDGVCVSLGTEANCGACGDVCVGGRACDGGACACDRSEALCDDTCTPLGTRTNCLSCDDACVGTQSCAASGCACPGSQQLCGAVCVSLRTEQHCLACGDTCIGGQRCTSSGCECPENEALCGGTCTPLATLSDCLDCGDACVDTQTCEADGCQCAANEAFCDGECVTLGFLGACTSCDDVCRLDQECSDEGCTCPEGEIDCGGRCVSRNSDANCGECGNVCTGALGACADGRCGCEAGNLPCAGVCEDPYSLDACGLACEVCAADEYCDGNGCQRPLDHELRISREGLLEMESNGWLPVCGTGFDELAAEVACTQLGGDLIAFSVGVAPSDPTTRWRLEGLRSNSVAERLTACWWETLENDSCVAGAVSLQCTAPPRVPDDCSPLTPESVVINEVWFDEGRLDGHIELFGTPGTSLDGVQLINMSLANGIEQITALHGQLNDEGFALLSNEDGPGVVGWFPAIDDSAHAIRLVDCAGAVLDAVGWSVDVRGWTRAGEGAETYTLPTRADALAAGRSPDGTDTNNNVADFVPLETPSPLAPNVAQLAIDGAMGVNRGSIGEDAPTFSRPGDCFGFQFEGEFPYATFELTNDDSVTATVSARLSLERDGAIPPDVDEALIVYDGPFDPLVPQQNCDSVLVDRSGLIRIPTGRTYTFVMTTERAGFEFADWELDLARFD